MGYCTGAIALALAFAAAFLVPGRATAQAGGADVELDAEAQEWFQAGRMAFSNGRFDDALQAFRKAHSLSERPELLFNIGSAADRLGRDEEALEAFEAYLRERPDAPNRAEVEGRIRELRRIVEQEAEEDAEAEAEAPTARDAASTAVEPSSVPPSGDAPAETPERDEGPSPWLWAGIGGGVAVVAVVVGVAVAVSGGGGEPSRIQGDVGGVIFTLRGR